MTNFIKKIAETTVNTTHVGASCSSLWFHVNSQLSELGGNICICILALTPLNTYAFVSYRHMCQGEHKCVKLRVCFVRLLYSNWMSSLSHEVLETVEAVKR